MDLGYAPKMVGWEATLACNLRCIHCGSEAGKPRANELDSDEALNMCHDLARAGCETLVLSGGEPLVRADWDRVASLAAELGLKVRLISNGMLVADQIDRIRASGVRVVGLSLDGLAATHDMIRRDNHSFERIIKAVEALERAGIRCAVVTHVSRMNLNELEAMYQLLASLPVAAWQVQLAFPAGRMAALRDHALGPADLPQVANFIARVRSEGRLTVLPADSIGYYTELEGRLREQPWTGCFAGLWVGGIESDGTVKGCLSMPAEFRAGNIRERSISEMWADDDLFAYNRFLDVNDLQGPCRGCEHGEDCRAGCAVIAHTWSGNRFNNPFCLYGLERASRAGAPAGQGY